MTGDIEQIDATAHDWHGNTVRLQVSPPNLFARQPYDSAYLSAIKKEVGAAQSLGMNVILTAQYERSGPSRTPMPNASTSEFWRRMAPMFSSDPGVWFDLFNEPLVPGSNPRIPGSGSTPGDWILWRNGGSGYVGMQSLVDTVRGTGARNLVLAEGLELAKTLAGLPGHELSGSAVAYAVHPYFSPGFTTPAAWAASWGNVSLSVPVVADEWGQYQSGKGDCQPSAPSLVPTFLAYLAVHHIGLVAWALLPNVLVQGSSLSQPTTFTPGVAYVCAGPAGGAASAGVAGASAVRNGQGAGAAVMGYFGAHSQSAPSR